jgi:high-affinity K+ transport system ATPase subunit B
VLFSFNDEFIAEMCGGLNDDDTLELFADGVTAMRDVVAANLARTVGRDVEVTADEDLLVVDLSEAEAAREFGAPGVQMQPVYRQAFIQSISDANRAFNRVVNRA